jgi:3D (Asp-Asp-Asp) domain-containing protein
MLETLILLSVLQLPPNPYTTIGEDGQIVVIGDEQPLEERPHLTKQAGVFDGPSGKETYYNLNMNRVVSNMRSLGYSEEEYPYGVREDGVKMLGEYVIIAANLNIRPRGTIVETSLGPGIVCDTGSFANYNTTQIDIAVTW